MWSIKNIATLWLATLTMASCSPSNGNTINREKITSEIVKTFSNPSNDKIQCDTYQLDTITPSPIPETIESGFDTTKIKTIKVSDIKDWPLFMRGTKRHVWEFLWYNQYQDILSKYNTYDTNKLKEAKYSINSLDSLSFPLIVDWLGEFFPERAEDMIQSDDLSEYRDSLANQQDFIVVKNEWWKYVLWYYKWWKLYLATHVSIWVWNTTPKWFFRLWAKYKRNVSRKYNNAPMPYTIVIEWNICMHQWKVTWEKLSHGCVRVPWMFIPEIYNSAQEWTPVVLLP